MKYLFLILGLISGSFTAVCAQRNPAPTSTPIVESSQRQQGLDRQADINQRSQELRMNENFPVKNDAEAKIFRDNIQPIYRAPTKEELKVIAPDAEVEKLFADFLRQKNTGLIKLIPEKNCGETANVVNAAPECAKYTMPGGGASFSFRTENYRIRHLGDLNYTGKSFRAFGTLAHGIFVNLGDVPLEKIDLKSAGIDFLAKFEPAADFKEAGEIAVKLDAGIKNEAFTYKNLLPVAENTTYALRSIAYQGTVTRSIQTITYNELDLDKRKDVIVVFRVVKRGADGSVTILWKELSNKNAPKLKENK
ncbi:MAG TPA: hypothetical protein VNB22_15935 [Pyrinomonadaceae bacterium]|nr:hypothetical protein [Pyrinomonadaceae bacterium]